MGTITTLRPSTTSSGAGWTPSAGTLHGVTSDNSDLTYATWAGTGSPLILGTPVDSPPVGERRHQVRLRARGEDGDAWWSVRLNSGALTAAASAQFTTSPTTVTGSWGFGAPADGPTILSTYVDGQSAGLRIEELYLDVDSREAPTLTAQVLDGSGTPSVAISDTAQPTVRADDIDLDGLNARQYRYWVTQGATIVWDTGIVSGASADQMTSPLENGSYTAHVQIWSTLGASTANPSDEETLAFTVSVGLVPAPDNPTVDQVDGTPFYLLTACAPYVGGMDGEVGYIEIQRVDCPEDPTYTVVTTLGPLETGECAEWTDYSLPRSGVGLTCEHQPEQCCSYYRARTIGRVDGGLRVSNWSDFYDPAIPAGVIVMWPGTNASVPSGWDRVTALDGQYPKGIATAATEPGTTGGSATHLHVTGGHVHDTTHGHTTPTPTAAATGTANAPNTAGALKVLSSHTHTRPSANSVSVSSGSGAPSSSSVANDPARLEVIWTESDGTPLGVPNGALAFTGDISLSGWTDYASAANRFFKGAAAAGNGGTTAASTVDAHTHTIDAHTHTGTAHTHLSGNTGTASSTLAPATGTGSVTSAATHDHPITVASASTQALASTSGGSSGAAGADLRPPFRNVRVKENTSGGDSLPVGLIAAWRGALGAIPDNWALCDGTGGTLDLIGLYPQGATSSIGGTGGSASTHSHTGGSHTHSTTGHSHTSTTGVSTAGSTTASTTATVVISTAAHTHVLTDTNSTTPTVTAITSGTLGALTSQPPFEEVAFIQLVEEPVAPPDPEVFCLTWDENEHLIRSTGPAGPVWSPVLGKFEWTVDRPFTAATGVNGARFVTSAPPGGRNLSMVAAVESEAELAQLRAVLARPLVLISPSDANEVWAAPVTESVRIIKIGRIRQVTATFIGTGPQPPPQLADVE